MGDKKGQKKGVIGDDLWKDRSWISTRGGHSLEDLRGGLFGVVYEDMCRGVDIYVYIPFI